MRKPTKKAKKPSRKEVRMRYWCALVDLVSAHVSRAYNEGFEFSAKHTPNGTVKQFNADFSDALLANYNRRRDWSKVVGKS